MLAAGPPLERLLRRLSECPPEFLETCSVVDGGPQVVAIIADLWRTAQPTPLTVAQRDWLKTLIVPARERKQFVRYWGLLGIAAWLLSDPWFQLRHELAEQRVRWMQSDTLAKLAELVRPDLFLSDPDRREELVRLCLRGLNLRPDGEDAAQALDRLNTLDSVERQRILAETAAAERRAREVREAMARQQALESASRYGE